MKWRSAVWKNTVKVSPLVLTGSASQYYSFFNSDGQWYSETGKRVAPKEWNGTPEEWSQHVQEKAIATVEDVFGKCDETEGGRAVYHFSTKDSALEFAATVKKNSD